MSRVDKENVQPVSSSNHQTNVWRILCVYSHSPTPSLPSLCFSRFLFRPPSSATTTTYLPTTANETAVSIQIPCRITELHFCCLCSRNKGSISKHVIWCGELSAQKSRRRNDHRSRPRQPGVCQRVFYLLCSMRCARCSVCRFGCQQF